MERLTAAIERFESASVRLEKAAKRIEARQDGARAQARMIEKMRLETLMLRERLVAAQEGALAESSSRAMRSAG